MSHFHITNNSKWYKYFIFQPLNIKILPKLAAFLVTTGFTKTGFGALNAESADLLAVVVEVGEAVVADFFFTRIPSPFFLPDVDDPRVPILFSQIFFSPVGLVVILN